MSALMPEGTRWCTFIGGSVDGKRSLIRDDVEFWEMADYPAKPELLSVENATPLVELHLTVYRYRRVILMWHQRPIHVFVWEGLHESDIIPALIGGYRRDKGQY
jgi:hypothetical protein